ncbi:hypothetical protein Pint_31699 [Pistacia integerrima]|uniref:Uncharacterized protein n=1 Tax=Pistacia integerrima TaxID=434235 RepID=A0ACC0XMC5_9ROSI|nr:hypothetical protein Pint_31699 [Pistacia integerrima]
MGKERRRFEEKDDMATWSAARVVVVVLGQLLGGGRWISGACLLVQWGLKPNSYDFKVEVFSLEYDILNVDPDEYSYICFIKDVKKYMASENEVVEMNPYEKFKVEVELPLSRARYVVEGDDDMEFIFEQYKSFGKRVIRVYVEAIPVDFSVESDESDHEEDHESGQDGQGSGVGSGGVEENQTRQGSGGVENIEVQGEMSEYHEDSSYEGSTDDENTVTRFSKHMKGQQFAYKDNGKIHFKVGQVFEGVDHFRKEKFTGLRLRNLFWAVSSAANIIDFQQAMEMVEAINREAHRNIRNMKDYVDSSLRITSYVKTYADYIHVIPDPLSWPDLLGDRQLNPPIKHSKVGRPKKARKMTKGVILREEKPHQPQQVRHVNIEAIVKGSRYLRSVELKHAVVFWCGKTVEA